jgi:hypothetical protein
VLLVALTEFASVKNSLPALVKDQTRFSKCISSSLLLLLLLSSDHNSTIICIWFDRLNRGNLLQGFHMKSTSTLGQRTELCNANRSFVSAIIVRRFVYIEVSLLAGNDVISKCPRGGVVGDWN